MHPISQQQAKGIAAEVAGPFSDPAPHPAYYTVGQFSKRNPAFTEPSLRNLTFKVLARDEN